MGTVYQRVELDEGTPVQYVGVYAMRWQPEWGEPSVGFVEVNDTEPEQAAPTRMSDERLRQMQTQVDYNNQYGIGGQYGQYRNLDVLALLAEVERLRKDVAFASLTETARKNVVTNALQSALASDARCEALEAEVARLRPEVQLQQRLAEERAQQVEDLAATEVALRGRIAQLEEYVERIRPKGRRTTD